MNKSPIVIVPKYHRMGEGFSKKEVYKSFEHPGRRTAIKGYQSPASWICDLMDRKQCVLLCSFCSPKFNFRKFRYRKMFVEDRTGLTDGYQSNGYCDACKQLTSNAGGGTAYVAEETYASVCREPISARRAARASAKAWPVSYAIKRR